jgi:ubiquinol-cytochrome c reductase cytochrome c1 subunit
MKSMIKTLIGAVLLVASSSSMAAGGGPLFHVNVDLDNHFSLQRGAKLFVNYCLSCHAASYSRYNRVAEDLDISEENMKELMMFTGRKYGDTMTVALTTEQGKEWFGAPPPDLSVRARSRGADWIYSFLKSFYLREGAARGVDNLQFPGTSMPHVLWELQGFQTLNEDAHHDSHSGGHGEAMPALFHPGEGSMTEEEYDQAITDLVNFLVYLGEPAQLKRKTIGVGVLFFLVALGVLAYYMKRDYWKDIH